MNAYAYARATVSRNLKVAGQPSQFTHRDNYIHNTLNVLYKQCSVMRDVKGSEGVREGRGRREKEGSSIPV